MKNKCSIAHYYANQQDIDSNLSELVEEKLKEVKGTDYKINLQSVLKRESIEPEEFYQLLKLSNLRDIETMAKAAMNRRLKHFGNTVYLFSPLYFSNYCNNGCIYCGFRGESEIERAKLNDEELHREMKALRDDGIEEVLMLTGESQKYSPIEYICNAVEIARNYFRMIGVEIYPVNIDDYKKLHEAGADFVTVFQETYQKEEYSYFHPHGSKRNYYYRFNTQERSIQGGMRGVGFGALFGLADPIDDAFCLGYHAYLVQKKYPHAEIAISLPRIRPTKNQIDLPLHEVSEQQLFIILLAIRLFLPYASITISTRENKRFRDLAIQYAATKISASVDTGIGNRTSGTKDKGDAQFKISDERSLATVEEDIRRLGLTPVTSDYLYV